MSNAVQPVSFAFLTVGLLFPPAVHIGVTFLWSGPQGGSHNNSHLSMHVHRRTLAHTLSTKSKQRHNNVNKLMTFAVWISDFQALWIPGILISLCVFPSDRHHLFLHLSNLCKSCDFDKSTLMLTHTDVGPQDQHFLPPVCLAKTNVYLLLVLRSSKICLVQPIWFMI